ncbi:MAG: uncharacterized protein JWO47_385 [Candidatus Saccharibacteria bacterium]|nr:uncharacterized protein [Candidatus Saccharibacteria bacterium]
MKKWIILTLVVGVLFGMAPANVQAASQTKKACSKRAAAGSARCNAQIVTDSKNKPLISSTPVGYGPADFKNAYGVKGSASVVVAVVVAYDAPHIADDLNTYSRTFGIATLPSCTSESQSSCFKKYDERGGSSFPAADSGWAVEASMDVESVHGLCPHCRIDFIEAASSSMADLGQAVDQAASLHAKVVSNSYGGPETASETSADGHYNHAGVVMVASSGDSGYGTSYPAASPYVVAVGGTDLHMNGAVVTSETAWLDAGSGCSKYESKPTWQHDTSCKKRSIADVAADADPATGAAVYDSYPDEGRSGWFKVGGTSLAAPLVAGMLAASGRLSNQPAWFYSNASMVRDIVSGHNGSCKTYLCLSGNGYDGPTGLGVLNRL